MNTPADGDILGRGVRWIRDAVGRGELSAEEVTHHALTRIETTDRLLGAFIRTDPDGALAAARAIDRARIRGEHLGPLAGVPVGIKDQIVTRGLETTAGSRILEGFVPPYDATVVARLRAAGAIVVGKTNQDEFAMGSSTETSAAGPCRNPWDVTRVPGGSSGGSATAVAARQVPLALGTDTGGSVRQPAAFTGTVGVKPTYGRVSRFGAIAYASSLDQIGPLALSVADAALCLEVIAGHDPLDSTSSRRSADAYTDALEAGIEGVRVGVPGEYFADGMTAGVRGSVEAGLRRLQDAGAELVPIELPHTRYCVATYYVIATAEASSNLARYDGVRYGRRAADAQGLSDLYGRTRDEGFGAEVKRRILLGTFVLSSGYYDAYYRKAQQVRALIRRDFVQAFEQVDLIASPTSPCPAFRVGDVKDPIQMYLMDIFTLSANLAGVCGISIPAGFDQGLPVGLQLMGRPYEESLLLRAARAHELRFTDASAMPAVNPEVPGGFS